MSDGDRVDGGPGADGPQGSSGGGGLPAGTAACITAAIDGAACHVVRAIERALGIGESPLTATGVAPATLGEALSMAGIGLAPLSVSCREAIVLAADRPLLFSVASDDGALRHLVLSRGGPRHAQLVVLQDQVAGTRTVDAAGLAMLVGARSPREPLTFHVATPSLPLDCLRLSPAVAGAPPIPRAEAPWKRLRALIQLERRDIWALALHAMVAGLMVLATPVAVQTLVNTVAFGTLLQPLVVLMLVLLVVLGAGGALALLQRHAVEYLQRRIFVHLTLDLAARLPRVQARIGDKYHPQELVNRFFDVMTVKKAGGELLLEGLDIILKTVLGLLLLALYHPILLVFDVLLILSLVAVFLWLGRNGTRTALDVSDAKYEVAAWLEEVAGAQVTFRSLAGAQAAVEEANRRAHRFLDARRQHYRVVLRQDVALTVIQVIASVALLGLGGWLVLAGQLTLGQLVAAELVLAAVLAGLSKLPKQLANAYALLAGLEKLGKLVDLPLEARGGRMAPLSEHAPALALESAVFEAPACGSLTSAVDLVVAPGEHLALTGQVGAPQHPVLDAFYGLRSPVKGRVRVDGEPLTVLAVEALRARVSLVRRAEIVQGTIEENLRLGNGEVSHTRLRAALAEVDLLEEIDRLPKGLLTPLTAGGSPLSPSQRTLLTLARVLLAEPEVLLIDESLDGLEPGLRARVVARLMAVPGRTLVVATRQDDILPRFNRAFRLNQGRLEPWRA